ncbi:MAG: acyl carrier protein [Clostridiaceae bacterium]|nr:acyl carrier protein [Clostridiaceae bacterium]
MTQEKILEFFKEKKKADGLSFDTDLFKGGYIDSLFALEMVVYLEDTFRIRLRNTDINEENFRTIDAIAAVVDSAVKEAAVTGKPAIKGWEKR